MKLYLEQKGTSVEKEVAKSLETLFTKFVPAGVEEFIALRSGNVLESRFFTENRYGRIDSRYTASKKEDSTRCETSCRPVCGFIR